MLQLDSLNRLRNRNVSTISTGSICSTSRPVRTLLSSSLDHQRQLQNSLLLPPSPPPSPPSLLHQHLLQLPSPLQQPRPQRQRSIFRDSAVTISLLPPLPPSLLRKRRFRNEKLESVGLNRRRGKRCQDSRIWKRTSKEQIIVESVERRRILLGVMRWSVRWSVAAFLFRAADFCESELLISYLVIAVRTGVPWILPHTSNCRSSRRSVYNLYSI